MAVDPALVVDAGADAARLYGKMAAVDGDPSHVLKVVVHAVHLPDVVAAGDRTRQTSADQTHADRRVVGHIRAVDLVAAAR